MRYMLLLGQEVIDRFAWKHSDLRAWLNAWSGVVQSFAWRDIDDVRKIYPHADGVKLKSRNVVTVFNCKGNEYRLLTYISYDRQIVRALEVLTHADYSKDRWKARY